MAYHETYQIALATAAPIIVLANTVTITDLGNFLLEKWDKLSSNGRSGIVVVLVFVAVSFITQAFVFYIALNNLFNGSDSTVALPGRSGAIVEVGSLLLVPALIGLGYYSRYVIHLEEIAMDAVRRERNRGPR